VWGFKLGAFASSRARVGFAKAKRNPGTVIRRGERKTSLFVLPSEEALYLDIPGKVIKECASVL
jgi:hypothetical protein